MIAVGPATGSMPNTQRPAKRPIISHGVLNDAYKLIFSRTLKQIFLTDTKL